MTKIDPRSSSNQHSHPEKEEFTLDAHRQQSLQSGVEVVDVPVHDGLSGSVAVPDGRYFHPVMPSSAW